MQHDYLGQAARPLDVVMPAGPQEAAELLLGAMVGMAVLWGIVRYLRIRDSRILASVGAGCVACLLESHAMTMLKFLYPQVGQHVLYTGFGNPVPLFMGLMYGAFFGAANCIFLITVRGALSLKAFTLGLAALFVAELGLEVVCIRLGLWAYFDDQPFVVGGFPVHVAVVVGCMSMVLGAFSRVWFDRVNGLRQFALVVVGPLVLIGCFHAFTYPVAFALESEGGVEAAQIGALLTIAISFSTAFAAVRWFGAMPVRRPAPVSKPAPPREPAIARGTLIS